MSDAEMAGALIEALAEAAGAAAGAPTALVALTCDRIADPGAGERGAIETEIVRATRTLVFAAAALRGEGGRMLMSATSVHKVA